MSSGLVKTVGRKECIKLKAGFIIIIITRFCNDCLFVCLLLLLLFAGVCGKKLVTHH